jgi:poly-gamma-glutamate capsule biosynthesis protein CapA/YwtB (metallophosphatase superfamily)
MKSTTNSRRTLYTSERNDIDIALAGEALISQGLSMYTEPNYLKLVELIRGADARYVHLEMLFHNYEHAPTDKRVGTYMRCDPKFIADLQWMGFQMMSVASNHSIDFGEGGILKNIENLNQYGVVHAGTGRNLAEARAPAYLETAKGRVALLSGTTTLFSWGRAGDQRRDMQGRPGANLLRHYTEYTVDKKTFDHLRQFGTAMGFVRSPGAHGHGPAMPPDTATEIHMSGFDNGPLKYMKFTLGKKIERHSYPHQQDLEGTLERIRDARRMAQWVIVAMHNQDVHGDLPPEHAITMYHAMVDAGADIIAGTGPHQDRGIEIYKGRPIFYGIGDFILQNDTVLLEPQDQYENLGLSWNNTPADFYDLRAGYKGPGLGEPTKGQGVTPHNWQNGMHRVKFEGGKLKEIRIFPVDLGYGKPRWQQGRPVLATGQVAKEILDRYQRLSKPFGTRVNIRGEMGVVRL